MKRDDKEGDEHLPKGEKMIRKQNKFWEKGKGEEMTKKRESGKKERKKCEKS